MKATLFALTLTIAIGSTLSQLDPDAIAPCKYTSSSATIMCSGYLVTDTAIKTVGLLAKTSYFRALYITLTSITKLEKDTFPGALFDNIYIESNEELVSIDPSAFAKQQVSRLRVINNPLLSDNKLYQLANNLNSYYSVNFENNGITEIPDNAFTTDYPSQSLEEIIITNNKITKIGAKPFTRLPRIGLIKLNNNLLATLSANAFHFTALDKTQLTIELQYNRLTAQSFTTETFNLPANKELTLNLEYNQLTALPESVFKRLIDTKVKLLLTGNQFQCDCSLKWLFNSANKASVSGLRCYNHADRDLFSLSASELGNC